MKGTLIGYYRKYGEFTPKDSPDPLTFDNVVLQFTTPLEVGTRKDGLQTARGALQHKQGTLRFLIKIIKRKR